MKLAIVTLEDAEALARVHAEGFDKSWDGPSFRKVLSGPGVFGFLAVDGEAPLGLAICRTVADEIEVLTINVTRAARRRGIARTMIVAALSAGRAAGASQAFLEVATDNTEAIGLYGGLGFEQAGLRKGYYDRGPAGKADALVMRLDLAACSN